MDIRLLYAKFIAKLQRPSLRNCIIDKTSKVYEKSELQNVKLGKYSYIGKSCVVSDTEIGNFCSIAGYSQIGGGMHPINMVSSSPCFTEGKSAVGENFANIPFATSSRVVIGNDVWIGAGCYIKGGVHIGNGAVIGAHSVVTHDVEPFTIVAGVPAKPIRKRFDDEITEKLQELEWWNWSENDLKQYGKYFETPEMLLEVLKEDKR